MSYSLDLKSSRVCQIRTDDLLVPNQARYRTSLIPYFCRGDRTRTCMFTFVTLLVPNQAGIQLPITPRLHRLPITSPPLSAG